mmetsp:Transcript_48882/g.121274  ORF Transcript_48882/g.121274 Transcript_48882/m.121274 type:complete len:243 (-) Transcript_48882:442-1170(-)
MAAFNKLQVLLQTSNLQRKIDEALQHDVHHGVLVDDVRSTTMRDISSWRDQLDRCWGRDLRRLCERANGVHLCAHHSRDVGAAAHDVNLRCELLQRPSQVVPSKQSNGRGDLHDDVHILLGLIRLPRRDRPWHWEGRVHNRRARLAAKELQALEELFGHERHEGVQHPQPVVQACVQHRLRCVLGCGQGGRRGVELHDRLDGLEVHIAQASIPEFIHNLRSSCDIVSQHGRVELVDRRGQFR